MKSILITLFLCFLSLQLDATWRDPVIIEGKYHFLINEASPVQDFDYAYDVRTNRNDEHLILDCQSFIQGLYIFWQNPEPPFEREQLDSLILSEPECMFIGKAIFSALEEDRELCLKVDTVEPFVDVGTPPEYCFNPDY